jgi:tRNA modification GTPase
MKAHRIASAAIRPFRPQPFRTARLARVVHPVRSEMLDRALYVAYEAPHSYTGEEMVELSTHGGLLVPSEALGALLAAGARQAEPGEFTRRALANGKLDLLQAEAIGDLVAATAPAQRRAALGQLDRGLSRRIEGLREQVLELETLCCYEIDFPEEDSGPVAPEQIDRACADLQRAVAELCESAAEGERLTEGAVCVIAGRPNAGKSSLFNALLGRERAIVTDVPGTTRDAIEAHATCEGFPFRMIDTAGLRESDDVVERLGIAVSRRYLAAADVVLLCVEANRTMTTEEGAFVAAQRAPTLVVRTKVDLCRAEVPAAGAADETCASAHTGEGVTLLRQRLAEIAFGRLARASLDIEPLITRERHRIAVGTAARELQAFSEARAADLETAVAATHLRAAVTALEDVIGLVSSEDVLDRVFATFCVGK